MTTRQKIQLHISEVRDRLNERGGLESDDDTPEIKAEERALRPSSKT